MRSGAAFSAIFLIWIIAFGAAFYVMMPDINSSINSVQSIDSSELSALLENNDTELQAIDYTPLGIFSLNR